METTRGDDVREGRRCARRAMMRGRGDDAPEVPEGRRCVGEANHSSPTVKQPPLCCGRCKIRLSHTFLPLCHITAPPRTSSPRPHIIAPCRSTTPRWLHSTAPRTRTPKTHHRRAKVGPTRGDDVWWGRWRARGAMMRQKNVWEGRQCAGGKSCTAHNKAVACGRHL